MNFPTKLSVRLQILILSVLLTLGCEPEQNDNELLALTQTENASVSTPLSKPAPSPENPPKTATETTEKEAGEEKPAEAEIYQTPPVATKVAFNKQVGVLREQGDFWIGVPHQTGSMVYLRLAKDTEILVLDLLEDYYKVVHRSMIGFLDKRVVALEETDTSQESLSSSGGKSIASSKEVESSKPSSSTEKIAEPSGYSMVATPCTGGISEELFPGVSCALYRSKVHEKVGTLENYIKRIIDKSEINREKSIDSACRLFVNEQARVYTSSLNEAGRSRPIRKYLNSLMALSYDKVEIEWTNIQYVSELRKGPDGRYFGFVHIEQKFQGFIDGQLAYGDITEKKITVVLEAYEVIDTKGKTTTRWDVFLSDIGVEHTQNIQ